MTNEYIFIVPIFSLINGVFFYKYGIKIVTDSERYLEYATNLRSGFYFDPHNFWYIGYSLYILLLQLLNGDMLAIIVGQYILSFLSVVALYHASLHIGGDKKSALCTALCYLFFVEIFSWNSYVLTESLYISFTCFSLYFLTRVEKGNRLFIAFTCAIVLFTVFIKPTGIALMGAVIWVVTSKILKHISSRVIYVSSIVFIAGVFLYLVNRRLATYLIMENYQLGEVIYGVTTIKDSYDVNSLIITPPQHIYQPTEDLPPLLKIIGFFFHHPFYWIKLFFAKLFYLLLHVRPFWTFSHNMFSLFFLIPIYWFGFKGALKKKFKSDFLAFATIYLLIHILSVCMTSEDWDGRFLMPMLPVIFIFSGHGIVSSLNGIKIFNYLRLVGQDKISIQ